MEARKLRDAFGTFPTGVTVVTCASRDGVPVGITANSFVSLSLAPPLVSVALHRSGSHLQKFLDSGAFAINVLQADQHRLSNLFARPSQCSWQDVRFHVASSGHIVLNETVASFHCKLSACHPVGDHLLLVGEVQQFTHSVSVEPLVFLRGRYGTFRLTPHTPPVEPGDVFQTATLGWG